MNSPIPAAVQDLTQFCEVTYGVPAMETRILISSLLPTRYPPIWLLMQTGWNPFMTHLAYVARQLRALDISDTWHLRAERPRQHNKSIMIHLASRETEPRLFADRYWQLPGVPIWRQSRYPLIAQECVRIRLQIDPAKYPEHVAKERFQELACQALGAANTGNRGGIVPTPPSEDFARRVKLLPLIDPMLSNIHTLMRNLCYVPANHAALCGRQIIEEVDLRAQAHVLRSTVPFWMEKMIRAFMAYGSQCIRLGHAIRDTGYDNPWRNAGSHRNPFRLGEKLVKELWMSGLLERNNNARPGYRVKSDYVVDLEYIMNGRI